MRRDSGDLSDLGRTGRRVSSLGLGLAAIGRPGYLNLGHGADLAGIREVDALEAHALDLLDEAWRRGVAYFDAARSYGRAEAFLSSWLATRGISEDAFRPTIGSKWGYVYTANWQVDVAVHEVKDLSLEQLDRQWERSRELLDGFLDLYQIHSATVEAGVLEDNAVLDRLAALRGEGIGIGLTTTGHGQAETVYKAIEVSSRFAAETGEPLFDSVQATWNLLEPSAGAALAEAADSGLTVIVKESMANGRLAGRDPVVAFKLASMVGTDLPHFDQLAIAAALAQPWSTVVLLGATTTRQLKSNIEADDAELRAIGAEIAALGKLTIPAEEYWSDRADLIWT